jgi:hypothetical protein
LLSDPISAAQQKKPTHRAPIPAQIFTAKKVFIANGGGDESRYEEASYSGGPDRTYNEFYAAMKTWGRYELVAVPGDADLVFEIRLTIFQLQRVHVLSHDSPAIDSQFRVVIRDAKTHQTVVGANRACARGRAALPSPSILGTLGLFMRPAVSMRLSWSLAKFIRGR